VSTTTGAVDHEPDCQDQRLESYEQDGLRGGHAHVDRCIGCGAKAVTWLVRPAARQTPAEDDQAHVADIDQQRANNHRLALHYETQRREIAARARHNR
jgi:hypothetical protein